MIGIYCRVSGDSQDNNYSIKEQRTRGENFAISLTEDFQIYEEVISGSTLNRQSMQALIEDIKHGYINKVWVIEFTRLSREVVDSHSLKKLFDEYNVDLYINDELTKIDNPERFLNFGINTLISDYERQRIKERVQRGANRRRREGGKWCSNPAYSYESYYDEKGKRKIKLNESEAESVVFIFNEYGNREQSIKQICTQLNDRMIPYRKSKKWYWSDVDRILKQSLYAGFYIFEGKEVESYVYPKFIDRELFNIVQAKLSERNLKNSTRYNRNLSSGIFKCYYCNQSLKFHDKKNYRPNGETYYIPQYKINHTKDCERNLTGRRTQNFRPKELLDEWLIYQFKEFASDVDSLYNYYIMQEKENTSKKNRLNSDIIRLENQKKEINSKKKKLITLLMTIEDEDLSNELKLLSDSEKAIKVKIESFKKDLIFDENKLFYILNSLKGDLINEFMSYKEVYQQRKMLFKHIETGYIKDREIHLKWITGKTINTDIDSIYSWWDIQKDKKDFHADVMNRLNSLPEGQKAKTEKDLKEYLIKKLNSTRVNEAIDMMNKVENLEDDVREGVR